MSERKYWYDKLSRSGCSFTDKEHCIDRHILYMLDRTQSMFKYSGLPDTIPERMLELYLQTNGNVCFAEVNGVLYVFTGGLGGEPDAYYRPTIYTVANPALKISKNFKINIDCVIIPNDSLFVGLLPLFQRYATALTENELSLNIASINMRAFNMIVATTDGEKESAKQYLQDIADGKPGIIASAPMLDGIRSQPYGATTNNVLTNLIEYEQYLRASWYNELGLNANYNMKRESINSGESQLNDDMLLPLVDNMLNCRKAGLEKVNAMFGTNISVALASAWEDNAQEIELEHEQIGGESDAEKNAE